MKSIYYPEASLMKMAPEVESSPSRPYYKQNYINGSFSLAVFTFSLKKMNERLKIWKKATK